MAETLAESYKRCHRELRQAGFYRSGIFPDVAHGGKREEFYNMDTRQEAAMYLDPKHGKWIYAIEGRSDQ